MLAVDLAHVCQGDVVPGEEAAVHDDHLYSASACICIDADVDVHVHVHAVPCTG